MNRLVTLFLFISCFTVTYSQSSKEAELLLDKAEWFEGSILLATGEELKGLVKFNDKNGVLGYHDGDDSRAFSERSVMGFEFFDQRINKQRLFYTLDYEDPELGVKQPFFFEVLRDYKNFAILIRTNPVFAKQKVRPSTMMTGGSVFTPTPMVNSYSTKTEFSQVETIFIMNDKGDIMPYFEVTNKEDGTISIFNGRDTKTNSSMIDRDILIEYITQPVYDQLTAYAKENQLKLTRKDDFMKILEYYDTLRSK